MKVKEEEEAAVEVEEEVKDHQEDSKMQKVVKKVMMEMLLKGKREQITKEEKIDTKVKQERNGTH